MNWSKTLKEIKKIEGYLVPGQETTLFKIASFLKPDSTIVEIGSYKGRSTACLAYGSRGKTKIYAIDTFEGNKKDFIEEVQFEGGNFLKIFKKNLKNLNLLDKIVIKKGFSSEVGRKWGKKIDFIFIDGSHLYKDVKKDFEIFYNWVKPGGIIAFHDVSKGHPGVLRVWEEIVKKKLSTYTHDATLYFGFKPSNNTSKTEDKRKLRKLIGYEDARVSIILPVYNRIDFTKRCLLSIKSQDYKNIDVYIIDSGSIDGTKEFIKKDYPKYNLIGGTSNWWWTKSISEGVKESLTKSKKGDFILTMNNDCFFDNDYVSNIVESSNANNRAIMGSLIVDAYNKKRVVDAGVKINWKKSILYGVAPHHSDKLSYFEKRETINELDTLPGKGTLIPIEVFKKTGNFKHRLLPHYIADYEFFCRAKNFGFELMVSTTSKLYNFSKQTGIEHVTSNKASYFEVFRALFSRRSKLNIFDHIIFTLLCCPKKYLARNLKGELLSLIHYLFKIFPLYYISIIIYRVKLLIHNIPILMMQNKKTRKIFSYIDIFYSRVIKNGQYIKNNKYTLIPKRKVDTLSASWLTKFVPMEQMKIVSPILKKGVVPEIAKPVVDIIFKLSTKRLSILDIGCSGAYYLDFFKFAKIKNFNYQGCDISPQFIKLAKSRYPYLKFRRASITHLPYKKNEFNLVLASAVLYYTTDTDKALSELARISSKYIVLHRIPIFDKCSKTQFISKKWYGVELPEIIYSKKELHHLFKKNNLKVELEIKNRSDFDIQHLNMGKAHQYTFLLSKTIS